MMLCLVSLCCCFFLFMKRNDRIILFLWETSKASKKMAEINKWLIRSLRAFSSSSSPLLALHIVFIVVVFFCYTAFGWNWPIDCEWKLVISPVSRRVKHQSIISDFYHYRSARIVFDCTARCSYYARLSPALKLNSPPCFLLGLVKLEESVEWWRYPRDHFAKVWRQHIRKRRDHSYFTAEKEKKNKKMMTKKKVQQDAQP